MESFGSCSPIRRAGLGVNDGYEILECDEVAMSMDGELLSVSTSGDGGGRIWLSLRSGG